MEFGIERLAQRLDARDAMALQDRLQFALGGLHAHDDVLQRRLDRIALPERACREFAALPGRFTLIGGSILSDADLRRALTISPIEAVIHCAVITAGSAREKADPETIVAVNVQGAVATLMAAARRGLADELVMRANDVIFAFPSLILSILLTAVLGPSALNAVLAIGVFNIPIFARLSRGAALSLWTRDYVLAARTAGKGATRISLEHILPALSSLIIVQFTLQVSIGIIISRHIWRILPRHQVATPSPQRRRPARR